MAESRAANTITRERVEDLIVRHAEPGWLKECRIPAWEAYLQTAMPTARDESWHRTDISALDLSSLTTLDFGPIAADPGSLPQSHKTAIEHFKERSGVLSQVTHAGGYLELPAELSKKGVIYCDLGTALKLHGEKLQPLFTKPLNPARDGKFGLMTRALFNCGLFLYVPAGLEIEAPFLSLISMGKLPQGTGGGAIFPRLLVVADKHSKVTLVHGASSHEAAQASYPGSLHAGLTEIYAEPGSRVSYLELQQLGSNIFSINRTNNEVGRDGFFSSLTVALGGKQVKSDIATYLQGPGAASEVQGLVLGLGHEHFNCNTIEEHNAPDTKSDINFRVALKDSASSVYQGTIRVDKCAQRTNAFQSNKNLLLGGDSRADSIPKLEILADDVKCSHGATVGPVDKEQVFYLMSRGLKAGEAEELIVLGFFRQILETFPLSSASEWVGEAISRRIFQKSQA